MIKAIIFDFDGVISNSPKFSYLIWKKLFENEGINFTIEEYRKYMGMKTDEKIPIILKNHGKFTQELSYQLNQKRDLEKTKIMKEVPIDELSINGVKEFIVKMSQKYKLAIATSSQKEISNILIERLGIGEYFETIVYGDQVEKGKPDPDIYLKVLSNLGAKPEECLVFEDAVSGIRSAKAAGIKVIALNTNDNKHILEKEEPVMIVNDFTDSRIMDYFDGFDKK